MSKYTILRVCILLLGLYLTGCASLVKGPTQQIPISTDPVKADVTVNGEYIGTTPIDLTLKRKRDHLITLSKEGYQSKDIAVTKSMGYAVWGNVIAGGLIGWGIDAVSGAQYELSPKYISLKLAPQFNSRTSNIVYRSKAEFIHKLNELDDLKERDFVNESEYNRLRTAIFKEYYPSMDVEVNMKSVNLTPKDLNRESNIDLIELNENHISYIQKKLRDERYYKGRINGILDQATISAIMEYKKVKIGSMSPNALDEDALKLFGLL